MSFQPFERAHTFADRASAGLALGAALRRARLRQPVVIALPRGGVPVACEVARALAAPLDILPVRKIGMPGHAELAIGAVAAGDVEVRDTAVRGLSGVAATAFGKLAQNARAELARREREYRGDAPRVDLAGRTAVIVDDGLATGLTMLAAVRAVRQSSPARLVVAAPVASREACEMLREEADEVLVLVIPEQLRAVGEWYGEFEQLDDDEVRRLLQAAHATERAKK